MGDKRNISEISPNEWSDLVVYIHKKVFGKLEYPYPIGLTSYADEVITSIRFIKDGVNETFRHSRLQPVVTIEFLPHFVVIWLDEHGFDIKSSN